MRDTYKVHYFSDYACTSEFGWFLTPWFYCILRNNSSVQFLLLLGSFFFWHNKIANKKNTPVNTEKFKYIFLILKMWWTGERIMPIGNPSANLTLANNNFIDQRAFDKNIYFFKFKIFLFFNFWKCNIRICLSIHFSFTLMHIRTNSNISRYLSILLRLTETQTKTIL